MCFSQPKLQWWDAKKYFHTLTIWEVRGVSVSYKNQFLLQIQHYPRCWACRVDSLSGSKLFCPLPPMWELFGLVHCWSIVLPQPKEQRPPLPMDWPDDVPHHLKCLWVITELRCGTGQDSMLCMWKFAYHFSMQIRLTGNREPDATQCGFHSSNYLLPVIKPYSPSALFLPSRFGKFTLELVIIFLSTTTRRW